MTRCTKVNPQCWERALSGTCTCTATVQAAARRTAYAQGRDDGRRLALEAIDEAMRVVASVDIPERGVRLSAMQHVRSIVAARTRRR